MEKTAKLQEWSLPESALSAAIKFANDNGDVVLAKQISFLHHYAQAIKSLAGGHRCAMEKVCVTAKYDDRRVTDATCAVLKDMRSTFLALKTYMECTFTEPHDCVASNKIFHCSRLDNLFRADKLFAATEIDFVAMSQHFSNIWSKDLSRIHQQIQQKLLVYDDKRESLLTDEALVTAFLNNQAAHAQVGTLCTALHDQVKCIKRLQSDKGEPVIPKPELKSYMDSVRKGIELVVDTFVVQHLHVDLPKVKNILLLEKTVDFVKAEVSGRNVELTQQMQQWLRGYRSGERSGPDPFVVQEPLAPVAAVHVSEADHVPMAASLAHQPGPDTTSAASSSAAAGTPAAPPEKKRKLADRIKEKRSQT